MTVVEAIDFTVKICTLFAIIGGGGITLFRLGRMTQKFEHIGTQQALEIKELKEGMQRFEGVLVALANQSGRTDRVEDRVALQGQRIDALSARFNAVVDKGYVHVPEPIERS